MYKDSNSNSASAVDSSQQQSYLRFLISTPMKRKFYAKVYSILCLIGILINPIGTFLLLPINASGNIEQSIEVCFVTLDYDGNVLEYLPQNTTLSLNLYTDAGHLIENQINSYGTTAINIQQSYQRVNRNLLSNDGIDDSYCITHSFNNPVDFEYTYTPVTITSDLNWLYSRYNDQNSIDFVDPDIAFPYSGEWFDNIIGNESLRNTDSDGHLNMNAERPHRRLLVVSQMDLNLPEYAVQFSDSITSSSELTLSSIPSSLTPGSNINLRFGVQNRGSLLWQTANDVNNPNPVNISYHWKNLDDESKNIFNGNRATLNHDLNYTGSDTNISLIITAPEITGNYELIIDLVHEGITWFSAKGASTWNVPISIFSENREPEIIYEEPMPVMRTSIMAAAVAGSYYTVQPAQPWNPGWHCGGYDCLSGIAEEYYQCSARGIPNDANWGDMTTKCWWPIYAANQHLYSYVPPVYASAPWNYIEVGWTLLIPPFEGGGPVTPPPPPIPTTSNFNGIPDASPYDPYAGMNGAYAAWPQVSFDRFVAWDGSYKVDQIKGSEIIRPSAPTVTGLATNSAGSSVTVYGVGIPKNHPMHVRVWNEYRYCWACGSGWDYHYQQGSAQHVKIVLFKQGWQYLGEVWNDSPDGRWSVTLPLGGNLNPGDQVFAEVQIEADFTFSGLKWWSNTYESVNFNIRNPKYFGYPYFGSGGGEAVVVPNILVDNRSNEERIIDAKASILRSKGGSAITNICGYPAKVYTEVKPGQYGAIVFINNKAVYTYGGTWDTFNYYGDYCQRFGVPVDDPHDGGPGIYSTPGAYQDFQKGRIYWSWKYIGKFVYGYISTKFENAGGTNSHYGWPISEVYKATENGKTLNCQNFEGGRICDGDFTPYSAAQQSLQSVIGRYPAISEIIEFCGTKQKISIPGGIAYYDPDYKNVRKITGSIYATWNENCSTYGLPENDTTSVIGFGGVTGYAQRFHKEGLVFDFYQKNGGSVVILEGAVKNKYDSKGGLGRFGFMQNASSAPYTAMGRCESSGLFWNLDNGRIYKYGSSYHVVYGDTSIGSYFFSNGADTKFGMPMNDENTDRLYSWQDFKVARLELNWPGGVQQTRGTEYCPGEEPTAAQIALSAALSRDIKKNEITKFCGEMEKVSIDGGIAYYDPVYMNVRKVTGEIYTVWGEKCNLFGLPENDTTRSNSAVSSGFSQRFNLLKDNTNFVNDFYIKEDGVVLVLEGVYRNLFENAGGLGVNGYPLSIKDDLNRGKCVVTEKEDICEKASPEVPVCPEGEMWDGVKCSKKEKECRDKGMEVYKDPNSENIICAKINQAVYINQWHNSKGEEDNPTAGRSMCGANAVTMALSLKKIIDTQDFDELKLYTHKDKEIVVKGFERQCDMVHDYFGEQETPPNPQHMYDITGSFSYVGAKGDCSYSLWGNIASYLKSQGLGTGYYEDAQLDGYNQHFNEYIDDVVSPAIQRGGGVVQGVGAKIQGKDIGHILLVVGYTDDGRIIVKDSYTSLMINSLGYSNNGNGAIYEIGINNFYLGNYVAF